MIFHEIRIKNFLRFQDIALPLSNQGLVLIIGENRDDSKASSNGAGKSSILEAVCWCLWGQTIRGLKDDDVINSTIGKNCEVELDIIDGDDKYTIHRHRKLKGASKANDLTLTCNGRSLDGKSIADTQAKVNKVVGLDLKTFQCMMPGAGLRLAEMTDAAIKEVLEGLLQMDLVAAAQGIVKEDLKEAKLLLHHAEDKLGKDKAKLSVLTSSLEDLIPRMESWKGSHQKEIESLELQLEEAKKEVLKTKTTLRDIDNLRVVLSGLRKDREFSAKEHEDELKKLQAQMLKYSRESSECGLQVRDLEGDINRCEQALVKLATLNGTCSHCLQDISADHVAKERAVLLLHRDGFENKLFSFQSSINNIQSEWKNAESTRQKIEADVSAKLHSVDTAIADMMAKVSEKERYCTPLAIVESNETKLVKAVEEAKNKTNPYEDLVAKANSQISILESSVTESTTEVEKITAKVNDLAYWVEGFSVRGMRNHMLQTCIPFLNVQANKYADVLTAGNMKIAFSASVELKKGNKTVDKFSVGVTFKDGSEDYKGCSSGERARADLAIALAVGDLALLRANKKISFRFLDEPFESVDEAGHEAVMVLLNQQKSQFNTVFVISHRPSFEDYFTNKLTVVKENGISTIQ